MKQLILLLAAISLVLALAACGKSSKSSPTPSPSVVPEPPSPTAKPTASAHQPPENPYGFDVLAAIDQGRDLLEKGEPSGFNTCKVTRTVWSGKGKKRKGRLMEFMRLCEANTKLAVRHVKEDRIQVITVRSDGTSTPAGFQVSYTPSRSVNTEFDVTHPPGYLVLAIRRAIPIRDKGPTEVVYTPYSNELDIPLVRNAGTRYLRDHVYNADRRLNRTSWRSSCLNAYPKMRDMLSSISITLAVVEHVDPDRFTGGVPALQLLRETLTTIGANRPLAYRYAVSPLGARGLFQFMPETYAGLTRNYSKTGLIADFMAGVNDHANAATASLLLFDDILNAFTPQECEVLNDDHEELGRALAAGYNYGPARVRRKMLAYDDWVAHLPEETQTYIAKYETFRSMLFPAEVTVTDL